MTRLFFVDTDLPGRLAVATCPAAAPDLIRDIRSWRAEGIQLVVSMLEPDEAEDLGVGSEAGTCRDLGIEFACVPTPDHWIPNDERTFDAAVALATSRLLAGNGVATHCYAGIGRSPMFAACVLVRTGLDVASACRVLSAARRMPVPEMAEQRQWVEAYARRRPRTEL